MGLVSVVVFFVVAFGLGALALLPLRKEKLSFAGLVMQLGLGICAFIVISLLFNLIHVPLDWRIFLGLAVIGCALFAYLHRHIRYHPKASHGYHLLIVLLAAGMLWVYAQGAFSYPYLEDDDPWGHATSMKYVQLEKTLYEPEHTKNAVSEVGAFQYIDPYPPAYDALIGVLAQLETSLSWTMKFFNALIIAFGYVLFYAFAQGFLGSTRRAFLATLVLLAMPAYFSHFIWAISLSVPLFFVALYALEKVRAALWWLLPASIACAAGLIVTPTHSIYFALFIIIYLLGRLVADRAIPLKEGMAFALGGLITVALWWAPMLLRYGNFGLIIDRVGFRGTAGTGDRIYSIADYVLAPMQNMINAPTGLGLAALFLAIIGLILVLLKGKYLLAKDQAWALITLGWLLLTLYAVNAAALPIKLSPFRVWMILAIPIALLAAVGWESLLEARGNQFWLFMGASFLLFILYNQFAHGSSIPLPKVPVLAAFIAIPLLFGIGYIAAKLGRQMGLATKAIPLIAFMVIALMLFTTGFAAKQSVNTVQWPPGGIWFYGADEVAGKDLSGFIAPSGLSNADFQGYASLTQLPPNTKVFSLTYRHAANIIGYDMFTCIWCAQDIDMRSRSGSVSAQELHAWLKQQGYQYVLIDTDYAVKHGKDRWESLVADMDSSGLFQKAASLPGFAAFSVP